VPPRRRAALEWVGGDRSPLDLAACSAIVAAARNRRYERWLVAGRCAPGRLRIPNGNRPRRRGFARRGSIRDFDALITAPAGLPPLTEATTPPPVAPAAGTAGVWPAVARSNGSTRTGNRLPCPPTPCGSGRLTILGWPAAPVGGRGGVGRRQRLLACRSCFTRRGGLQRFICRRQLVDQLTLRVVEAARFAARDAVKQQAQRSAPEDHSSIGCRPTRGSPHDPLDPASGVTPPYRSPSARSAGSAPRHDGAGQSALLRSTTRRPGWVLQAQLPHAAPFSRLQLLPRARTTQSGFDGWRRAQVMAKRFPGRFKAMSSRGVELVDQAQQQFSGPGWLSFKARHGAPRHRTGRHVAEAGSALTLGPVAVAPPPKKKKKTPRRSGAGYREVNALVEGNRATAARLAAFHHRGMVPRRLRPAA